MAIDFRCERCGRLVSTEATETTTECPGCGSMLRAPAKVEALPRPQVPVRPTNTGGPPRGGLDEQPEAPVVGFLARMMPWLFSALFHVGLLVILGFVTIVLIPAEDPPAPSVAHSGVTKDYRPTVRPSRPTQRIEPTAKARAAARQWVDRDLILPTERPSRDRRPVEGIKISGLKPGEKSHFCLTNGVTFFNIRGRGWRVVGGDDDDDDDDDRTRTDPEWRWGRANHVVYVVDRSGSMLETFDAVRRELCRSILRLDREQTFHVIFFSSGKVLENPPRRLTYATDQAKRETMAFLGKVQPSSSTHVLPAIRRAFEVIRRAPDGGKGSVIYLLTDGEFADNTKVAETIRSMNRRGTVCIHTVLHHHHNPAAENVLKQISRDNRGEYRFVPSGS